MQSRDDRLLEQSPGPHCYCVPHRGRHDDDVLLFTAVSGERVRARLHTGVTASLAYLGHSRFMIEGWNW